MRRIALLTAAAAIVVAALALPLQAGSQFPDRIALPNGFRPEGIAISGKTFFAGSIPTGAVYRGDLRSGKGKVLVPAAEGHASIGLKVDRRDRLFVAGGPTGMAFVYDADSGKELASYKLTDLETFVNDVIVTRSGAYFTDSVNQVMYRVPIGRNGRLGGAAETIPLTGDIDYDPAAFNANGIAATPDGKRLIIVQSGLGKLFTVDPESGVADEIALDEPVTQGDGLLLDGKTLYVVRNFQNRIAVVNLDRRLESGKVVTHIVAPPGELDVPTTIAEFGDSLYAVNARFSTTPEPSTEYWVTKLEKASHKGDKHGR
jgi:sugar lactone lactonase YvrE